MSHFSYLAAERAYWARRSNVIHTDFADNHLNTRLIDLRYQYIRCFGKLGQVMGVVMGEVLGVVVGLPSELDDVDLDLIRYLLTAEYCAIPTSRRHPLFLSFDGTI